MALKRVIGALLVCAAPLLSPSARAKDVIQDAAIAALPRLTAYHAVYDLSLAQAKGGNAPASARGRIAFEFSGSECEGYVEKIRQVTELRSSEGAPQISSLRSATFEAGDGKNYHFDIEQRANRDPADHVRGEARKDSGQPLSVRLQNPAPREANLAAEALFPSSHLRRLLASAQAGGHLLEALVYDGAEDGRRVFRTTATIGNALSTPPAAKAAQVDALKNMRRWPVSISYFDADTKEDQTALYVISFELYENGVSTALKLD
ncbi:cell envelope integrity EipB family protein [Methylocystis bryophila]|uniref:cell envelope integrity EipB family protein n=1 Tax=Methylocystis bryophila TaxID=655015 RepID=UPI001FD9AE8C|nr:cell envelope integrity EipB family protein [Methylocystis bryophila]BDV38387.1 hypothetical protein DSM21852_16400 [Methylocystis bryophila]